MIIDLSLKNKRLYESCKISEIAGRLNLETPPSEAVNVVGRNIAQIMETISASQRDQVILTGPMAVWAYMVVDHAVMHSFREVCYSDGRSPEPLVIARHG